MATWFISTGTPARDGTVVPLVDGEEAWKDILAAINGAKETINMAFWMMHLDTELDRPGSLTFKDPSDREHNTLNSILLKKIEQGVKVRVLLWILPTIPATQDELLKLLIGSPTFPPDPFAIARALARLTLGPPSVLLTLDLRLIQYALQRKIELLLEPHPTSPIGSWHQKTIIVDRKIAFVGGMNAKQNDWDMTHLVYDYNRTPHDTKGAKRSTMSTNKEATTYPPRHDYMTRIEGPLVNDVENNFIERWNQAIKDDRFYSYKLMPILKAVMSPSGSPASTKAQIVRTMPKYPATPGGEQGCFEAYVTAIRNAQKYIYIEDQYFRSQALAQELANACKKNPKLILIVITPPDYLAVIESLSIGLASPSTYWTAQAFDTIAKVVPDFCFFQLQVSDIDASGNIIFVPVDTHAKMMIVDDEWYTIGSCNINERGFIDEGEINVIVHNPAEALKLRKKVWSEHLKASCPTPIKDAVKLWYDHAAKNHKAKESKSAPPSRIFPFNQKGPAFPIVPKGWF